MDLKSECCILNLLSGAFKGSFASYFVLYVHTKRRVLKQPYWPCKRVYFSRSFEVYKQWFIGFYIRIMHREALVQNFLKQFCKVFHFECAHQATGSRTNTLTLRNCSIFTGCWGKISKCFSELNFKWCIMNPLPGVFICRSPSCSVWVVHTKRRVWKSPSKPCKELIFHSILKVRMQTFVSFGIQIVCRERLVCRMFYIVLQSVCFDTCTPSGGF